MAMDTDRPAAPLPRDDAPAGSEQRRTASQAAPRDRRHAGRVIIRPEADTGSRQPQTPRWPATGTATPLRAATKEDDPPAAAARCQPQVAAALQRCFTNPKTILDCMRLLARLTGELP